MRRKFSIILVCCFMALLFNLTYADDHEAVVDVEVVDNANNSQNNTRRWLTTGGGCVGGAILGSFLPIIGNAVGCVLGGVAGYFIPPGDKPTEQPDHSARLEFYQT